MSSEPNLMPEDWICGRCKQRQNIRISSEAQKERGVIRFPLFQPEDCTVSSITDECRRPPKKQTWDAVLLFFFLFCIGLICRHRKRRPIVFYYRLDSTYTINFSMKIGLYTIRSWESHNSTQRLPQSCSKFAFLFCFACNQSYQKTDEPLKCFRFYTYAGKILDNPCITLILIQKPLTSNQFCKLCARGLG